MKYFTILIFLFFFSCASAIPSQDIVVHFSTIDGPRFLEIPEGSLDECWHGVTWWTAEEHLENIREMLKKQYGDKQKL